jgi:CBS domain-containing protein
MRVQWKIQKPERDWNFVYAQLFLGRQSVRRATADALWKEISMQVQDLMTHNPQCCSATANLQEVANLMVQNNCGAIPIVDGPNSQRLIGIVTDRDIACRVVAQGKNPLQMTARDCMSSPVVTITPADDLAACCQIMEDRQLRRIPVVDGDGCCCGIVAQADIAKNAPEYETAEVVREISMVA